jgi:hypothetical protein
MFINEKSDRFFVEITEEIKENKLIFSEECCLTEIIHNQRDGMK